MIPGVDWEYDAEYGTMGMSVSACRTKSGQERMDNLEFRYSRAPDDTPPLPVGIELHQNIGYVLFLAQS